jgi:Ca2+:H+ antiporter
MSFFMVILFSILLIVFVISSVHQAEKIAHHLGEPFGALVLAVSVTIIEVALIISMMLMGKPGNDLIARDTVFSAIMIVMNGLVGLSILLGCLKHHELSYRVEGTNPALTVIIALAAITLVLPVFTTTTPGLDYSQSQLIFVGIASLVLYIAFVMMQTVRHADYFLPVEPIKQEAIDEIEHFDDHQSINVWLTLLFLVISLISVVVLAKMLSPSIEAGIEACGAPKTLLGVIIAALVLLPEGITAIKLALQNKLQISLNLTLGSAIASIGLTIPSVAIISIWFGLPLSLGINPVSMVLLILTMIVGIMNLATGRASLLSGIVQLVIFFSYLFLTLVP